jgi:tRNA G10  N-methylase Trm11
MQTSNYLYSINYDFNEVALSRLESKCIFDQEERDKVLFSDLQVEPSRSAFIKKRLDIIAASEDYASLLEAIKSKNITIEGFKVEYVVLEGDATDYFERLKKLKDIGFRIEGIPSYHHPRIIYGICHWKGIWYFGVLIKNNLIWQQHKQKPYSYSNSISIRIAKSLVNIAASNHKEAKLLDTCCGVGTIMLEACFAGNHIEGCDINEKVCIQARKNLAHFNYTAKVHHADIKNMRDTYDAAILDLPYNLTSKANDKHILHIIESAAAISDRLVIVSTSEITDMILSRGLHISAHCRVNKKRKSNVFRKVWLCEK